MREILLSFRFLWTSNSRGARFYAFSVPMSLDSESIQQRLLSSNLPREERILLRKRLWDEQARNLSMLLNQDRLRRYNYLSGLLDIFPQFAKTMSMVTTSNKRAVDRSYESRGQISRRHRLTGSGDDERLFDQGEDSLDPIPFAFEQTPYCTLIPLLVMDLY